MSGTTSTAISGRGLYKTHQRGDTRVQALNNVNIDVAAGDFIAICGPSGSGKSSLLNVLGLLDPPGAGEITLADKPVALNDERALEQLRRDHLGFIFQNFNLVPVLSAVENVELPLYPSPLSARERRQRALEVLHAVGLAERVNNRPNQLSGGQQQRVAVARALVRKPLLVLADEPTANLDGATTEDLIDLMVRLTDDLGTTFVIATHDPRVIKRARMVYTLSDGVLYS
ncbi:MAG: ABC transporter ATP-binding protein [Gammaproteobacteria bacterium]|nr:ABC transporter ATP-binding protein [Gammaproteobacteria bacterium]